MRAGEVVDDLLERRVVPDHEELRAVLVLGQQLARRRPTSKPLPTASRSSAAMLSDSQASFAVPRARTSGLV